MLTIKKSEEKEIINDFCKRTKRAYSPAYYAYIATDSGQEIASGFFEIKSDAVEVVGYESPENDRFLFDGILRAGFNYANENGIDYGIIPEPFRHEFGELFSQLNFTKESRFNINNFFNKYKNCNI